MFTIMSTEYVITTVIAILALLASFASAMYCRSNFKMSRYEFRKRRKEEKQAILKAEAAKTIHGYTFVITNEGMAQARNVVCSFPKEEFVGFHIFGSGTFPFLDSGKSFGVSALACENRNDYPTFSITWEDDYSKENSKLISLSVV